MTAPPPDRDPPGTSRNRATAPPADIMRLARIRVLHGPNAWIERPAVRFRLETGRVGGESAARLRRLLAGGEPEPGLGDQASKQAQPSPALDPGRILAGMIMDLQQQAGDPVSFSVSTPGKRPGQFEIVCECIESDLVLSAAEVALRFLNHLVHQTEPDFDLTREFDRRVMHHMRYRDSQREQLSVISAARQLRIPVRYVDKPERLIEIGLGAYTERFLAIMSSKSRELASRIARNKPLARQLLLEHGIPMPEGDVVSSFEEAATVVSRLGFPIVVKPADLRQGLAVTVGVESLEELKAAVEKATSASKSGRALVEAMIIGREYRFNLVGDVLIGVQDRVAAHVFGDGEHTVEELIAMTNQDPTRQPGHPANMHTIEIDDGTHGALADQGMRLSTIPVHGQHVRVKRVVSQSQGGISISLRNEDIHPDNVTIARLAAKAVGLDLCGLDFISPDVTQSYRDNGGKVLEVNSEPGFRSAIFPMHGPPQDVGMAVMDMFYPLGRPYQPIIVAMTAGEHTDSLGSMIKRVIRHSGSTVGLASSRATEIEGPDFAFERDSQRPDIEFALRNPFVTCAVLEIGQDIVENRGLVFSFCDVAIIGTDHENKLAPDARPVDRVISALVPEYGAVVLDAGDPRISTYSAGPSQRLMLVSADPDHPLIDQHRIDGGRTVTLEGGQIMYYAGLSGFNLMGWSELDPALSELPAPPVLQAVAAGMALKVPIELIREALGEDSYDMAKEAVVGRHALRASADSLPK
ncbi:MAG: hypothetical protein AB7V46_03520 [Thermomicrobiales bacterium]